MKQLTDSYLFRNLQRQSDNRKISSEKQQGYLRHLYFLDAFQYVHMPADDYTRHTLTEHITSIHYDSEFSRQLKLLGEIPRCTMLRHLIIFGLPELTLKKINEQLVTFGYLPLCEYHSLTTGERLDWLLIHLFELYEGLCNYMEPDKCLEWFRQACRTLDLFFIQSQNPRLQFMYFKALKP